VLGFVRLTAYLIDLVPHPTYEELLKAEDERIKALPKKKPKPIVRYNTDWMDEDYPINTRSKLNLESQEYFLDKDDELREESYDGEY